MIGRRVQREARRAWCAEWRRLWPAVLLGAGLWAVTVVAVALPPAVRILGPLAPMVRESIGPTEVAVLDDGRIAFRFQARRWLADLCERRESYWEYRLATGAWRLADGRRGNALVEPPAVAELPPRRGSGGEWASSPLNIASRPGVYRLQVVYDCVGLWVDTGRFGPFEVGYPAPKGDRLDR